MEQRLSLITLGVADLARSIAFYQALGWTRSLRAADGVAFFQLGGVGLSLFPHADLALDAGTETGGRGFGSITLAHNVRQREVVDAVVDLMVQAGAVLLKPPADKAWGGYGAYVSDPDGHIWEIAWNPDFPIDEEGKLHIPD